MFDTFLLSIVIQKGGPILCLYYVFDRVNFKPTSRGCLQLLTVQDVVTLLSYFALESLDAVVSFLDLGQ